MPQQIMYVNDVNMFTTYGMWCNSPDGWADNPRIQDSPIDVPGMAGGIVLPGDASVGVREFTVEGQIISPSGLVQEAHDLWDAAKQLMSGPELEVRFSQWPDRQAKCRLATATWGQIRNIQKGANFRLSFSMPSPYLEARQKDVYGVSAGNSVALSLESAPSFVDLQLIGTGNSTPSVTYTDAQGNLRGLISFNLGVPLPVGDFIRIDGVTNVMEWVTTNGTVVLNASPYLVEPYSFFVADPHDTDTISGPFLGAINCNVVAMLRKMYR